MSSARSSTELLGCPIIQRSCRSRSITQLSHATPVEPIARLSQLHTGVPDERSACAARPKPDARYRSWPSFV